MKGFLPLLFATVQVLFGEGNDHFADRVVLTGQSATGVADARLSSRETDEPNPLGKNGGTLWWSWVAPATGDATFGIVRDETFSSISNTALSVFAGGSLDSLSGIGNAVGAYSDGSLASELSLRCPVVAGQTYQIAFASDFYPERIVALKINRAPTITSNAAASATRGVSFTYNIAATDQPTSFSASGLPQGLIMNPYTGAISGVPLEAGIFIVPLQAISPAGTGSATLTINVAATAAPSTISPPVFSGGATAAAIVGKAFSYYPSESGSATISQTGGTLPPGLVLDSATGNISGTPTTPGTFLVNLSATNSAGSATAIVTFRIAAAPRVPLITSDLAASGTVGASFSYSLYATDSPTSYSASNLPPGLTFNTTNRAISGTPTSAGTFSVPLSATNAGGTGNAILTITIAVAAPPTPPVFRIASSSTASGVVGTQFVYAIDAGNTAVSFAASGLPPGLSLNAQNGYITGAPKTAGVFPTLVTMSDGNTTVSATIQFTIANSASASSGTPILFLSSAGATGVVGTPFSYFTSLSSASNPTFSASGLPPGLSISSFGTISGTPTAAGTYPTTLAVSSFNGSGTAVVTIRILASAPAATEAPLITSSASASGRMGASFSYTIAATDGPTNYAATGLPAGLSVNATTGSISGMPTEAGNFAVSLVATNALGSGTATLSLIIAATAAVPVIISDSTATGTVGVAFNYYPSASGTGVTFAVGDLPPGLAYNSASNVISGMPTSAGIFTVPISGTTTDGSVNATLTITIAAQRPIPVISSAIADSAQLGIFFGYTISGVNSPTSFSATNLPAGLSLNVSTGYINGTPTEAGVFTVPISATNSGGTGTATLTLTITAPATPVFSMASATTGSVGSSFSFTLSATNSPTNYAAANLPPGLTQTGSTISGTPTASGVFSVPVSATNVGGTGNATLTITIVNAAPLAPPTFTSAAAARGLRGSPFTFTLAAINAPISFSATGLPAGLSLNAATGAITGTPAVAGSASVSISANNAAGSGTAIFTVEILAAPSEAPVISSAAGMVALAGDPVFYAITATNAPTNFAASGLPTGLVLDPATGFITGFPTGTTGSYITLTATNSAGSSTAQLRFIFRTTQTATRISSSAAAVGTVGSPFTYSITATTTGTYFATGLPSGVSLNASTGIISGTPTTAGTFTASISRGSASATLKIIVGAPTPTVPIISSTAGMNAMVGDTFGYRITASNTPASFAATGLPAGLSLDAATGWITGTPTSAGNFNVALSATNASGTGTATLKISTVSEDPLRIRFTSPAAALGSVGKPFVYQLSAIGAFSPFSLTSSLPAGLSFNSFNAQITGTPTVAGNVSLTASVSGSNFTASATITIMIVPGPLSSPILSSAAAVEGYCLVLGIDYTWCAKE